MERKKGKQNVLIFGCGQRLKNYEDYLRRDYNILGLIDNNDDVMRSGYNGFPVFPASKISNYTYDRIIITPKNNFDIVRQLEEMGISKTKISVIPDREYPYSGYEALRFLLTKYEFSSVLDIGCGGGKQTEVFLTHGKEVTCIDKGNSVYFHKNHSRVHTIIDDFNQHHFDKQFDCVWCSHLLEHQWNVNLFLKNIHACLKEGGVVAITVPVAHDAVLGGHVTIWTGGLLLYNLVIAGFDCNEARVCKIPATEISVILQKRSIDVSRDLVCDYGDIARIRKYLPNNLKFLDIKPLDDIFPDAPFDGDIESINWSMDIKPYIKDLM